MVRVTTPTHKFTFPTDPSQYSKIVVTYFQYGNKILEKTKTDMTFDSTLNIAQYRLTQAETKAFQADIPVDIQVRVLTSTGEAMASDTFSMSVKDVLNEEIL